MTDFTPPAALVERGARDVHDCWLRFMHQRGLAVKPEMDVPFDKLSEVAGDIYRAMFLASCAALPLREVVEVLTELSFEASITSAASHPHHPINAAILRARALLARLTIKMPHG